MSTVHVKAKYVLDKNKTTLNGWQADPNTLLRTAIVDWAVIVAAWLVMSATESVLVTVIGVLTIAGRLHALGAILHDAAHADIRHKSMQWRLVEALAGWPISSTIDAMRYHHLRHHRYVGTHKDPYLPPKFRNKVLPMPLLYARGLLLPGWWTIRSVVGVLSLYWSQLQPGYARLFLQERSEQTISNIELNQCAKADAGQLCAHILVLGIIMVWQLPYLLTYLIPLHITGVLNARRLALEHPPVTKGKIVEKPLPLKHQYEITLDIRAGWLENWLLTPHNLGLHAAHHRYPSVAYRHLPKCQGHAVRPDNATS